jgi:hypothetical protein
MFCVSNFVFLEDDSGESVFIPLSIPAGFWVTCTLNKNMFEINKLISIPTNKNHVTCYEDVDWIHGAPNRIQRQAPVREIC